MSSKKINLNGKPVGRTKAGWLLFKETWRYFKADTELIFIPLITTGINLLLLAIASAIAFVAAINSGYTLPSEDGSLGIVEYAFIFVVYVIAAFCLALSEAGITNTVYTRAHGGNASLRDSLKRAFSHWSSLLLWSIITSTVGVLLRAIAERSKLLGRIVIAVLGVAWSVLTYFVVPAMVIDNQSAFASIKKSGKVFRTTWGETIVSNISIGVIFTIIHVLTLILAATLMVVLMFGELWYGLIALAVGYFLFLVFIASLQSAMQGILKTLLYIYAAEGVTPPNFNQELLDKMLARTNTSTETPAPIPQPTNSVPPANTSNLGS